MNALKRRVGSLEAIAEAVRYRPLRILAAERGVDPDRVIAIHKELEAQREQMRADGMSEREIFESKAASMGLSAEELERRCAALRTRLDAIAARS
jgi:hypothetical protein